MVASKDGRAISYCTDAPYDLEVLGVDDSGKKATAWTRKVEVHARVEHQECGCMNKGIVRLTVRFVQGPRTTTAEYQWQFRADSCKYLVIRRGFQYARGTPRYCSVDSESSMPLESQDQNLIE